MNGHTAQRSDAYDDKTSNCELMSGSGRELLERLAVEELERDKIAKDRGALPVSPLRGRSDASKGLDGFPKPDRPLTRLGVVWLANA